MTIWLSHSCLWLLTRRHAYTVSPADCCVILGSFQAVCFVEKAKGARTDSCIAVHSYYVQGLEVDPSLCLPGKLKVLSDWEATGRTSFSKLLS